MGVLALHLKLDLMILSDNRILSWHSQLNLTAVQLLGAFSCMSQLEIERSGTMLRPTCGTPMGRVCLTVERTKRAKALGSAEHLSFCDFCVSHSRFQTLWPMETVKAPGQAQQMKSY